MATQYYSSSQRLKPSIFSRIVTRLQLMYYQYEVTFSAYVLTPGEKLILNTVVVLLISLLMLGIFSYLPQFILRVSERLFWLYYGVDDTLAVLMGNSTLWADFQPDIKLWMWVVLSHDFASWRTFGDETWRTVSFISPRRMKYHWHPFCKSPSSSTFNPFPLPAVVLMAKRFTTARASSFFASLTSFSYLAMLQELYPRAQFILNSFTTLSTFRCRRE